MTNFPSGADIVRFVTSLPGLLVLWLWVNPIAWVRSCFGNQSFFGRLMLVGGAYWFGTDERSYLHSLCVWTAGLFGVNDKRASAVYLAVINRLGDYCDLVGFTAGIRAKVRGGAIGAFALAVVFGVVYALNAGVSYGKTFLLGTPDKSVKGLLHELDPQATVAFIEGSWANYGYGIIAGIVAVIALCWYVGRRLNVDSPALATENNKYARVTGWSLLATVMFFIVIINVMNVVIANVSQIFTNALNSKNELEYYKWLYLYGMVFVIAIPFSGTNGWVKQVLAAHWRRWTTFYLGEKFLNQATRAYYHITGRQDIDNPDERVHEDVRNFCDAALALLISVLGALITLVAFSGELWGMSQDLTWMVIGYSFVGTLVTLWLGRRLAFLNGLQLKHEANFRFSLTRVRENAESIAFYGGEEKELKKAKSRFAFLYQNYRRLIGSQRNLTYFTVGFDYVVIIIPSLVLAPLYFKGQIDVGAITKATFAFRMVLRSLEVIISEFTSIAKFSANVHRIGSFVEALDKPIEKEAETKIVTVFGDNDIEFKGVQVNTPDGARTLVRDLSFRVGPGESVLIAGPSGGGKSSILRVIAGLWNNGIGTIERPEQRAGMNNVFFLSQKAYMTLGSLREQITYPNVDAHPSAAELRKILETVNLGNSVDHVRAALAKVQDCDPATISDEDVFASELPWAEIFSGGEQQRLALARLIFNRPKIAILDEATSALDVKNEAIVYEALKATGTAFLSVGHRPQLAKLHDHVLELDGKGSYAILTPEEYLDGVQAKH